MPGGPGTDSGVYNAANAVENSQGEPLERDRVDLVGGRTRRRAGGIFVTDFDVVQVQVPVVLSLVDDRSQRLGHNVVYLLNYPVAVGMIGACRKLVHCQQLIYRL